MTRGGTTPPPESLNAGAPAVLLPLRLGSAVALDRLRRLGTRSVPYQRLTNRILRKKRVIRSRSGAYFPDAFLVHLRTRPERERITRFLRRWTRKASGKYAP